VIDFETKLIIFPECYPWFRFHFGKISKGSGAAIYYLSNMKHCLIKILLLLICLIPEGKAFCRDTVPFKHLSPCDSLWCLNQMVFSGVAVEKKDKITEYHRFCAGSLCGYEAFYPGGRPAAVHTYNGNQIHLVFYYEEGNKKLEYHQKILDQTYTWGLWTDYRENGTMICQGNYELIRQQTEGRGRIIRQWQSVKDGRWQFFDETGQLVKTQFWRKGKLVRTK